MSDTGYLLDTNAVVALFRGEPGFVSRLRRRRPAGVMVSSIVLFELRYGAMKSDRPRENIERIEALRFGTIDFDTTDAIHAGEIRNELERAGTPIGPFDTLLAGQARSRKLVLVTDNTREFERVSGVRTVNWLAP